MSICELLPVSSRKIYICVHTHLVDARESGQWRMKVGRLHLVLPPSPELSSPVTGLYAPGLGAERERTIPAVSDCHLWQTQGPLESVPDSLFLLHFLSQDPFPWGICPSFSSLQLLLTPPLGPSKKLTQVLLPRTSPRRPQAPPNRGQAEET